jgi:hypothetical protein
MGVKGVSDPLGCHARPPSGIAKQCLLKESLCTLSEKDTKLAQKLGQLQPFFILWRYSVCNAWADLHLLSKPNTFLALCMDTLHTRALWTPDADGTISPAVG